jgi:hypothetical protein
MKIAKLRAWFNGRFRKALADVSGGLKRVGLPSQPEQGCYQGPGDLLTREGV